jgi:hypothetical protein
VGKSLPSAKRLNKRRNEAKMAFMEFMRNSGPWYGIEGNFVKDLLSATKFPDCKSWAEWESFLKSRGNGVAIEAGRNVWDAYQAALDDMLLV